MLCYVNSCLSSLKRLYYPKLQLTAIWYAFRKSTSQKSFPMLFLPSTIGSPTRLVWAHRPGLAMVSRSGCLCAISWSMPQSNERLGILRLPPLRTVVQAHPAPSNPSDRRRCLAGFALARDPEAVLSYHRLHSEDSGCESPRILSRREIWVGLDSRRPN